MRRIGCFVFLFLSVITLRISAQNTLIIHQNDGSQICFGFLEKPVIKYTETDMILTTTSVVVEYPLSSISKFTFTEKETSVSSISTDAVIPTIILNDNIVCISGAKSNQLVSLISIDGRVISTHKTDANGLLYFSIEPLSKGIYIVKIESLICKITKL